MSIENAFAQPSETVRLAKPQLLTVQASLNYLAPSAEKPVTYTFTPTEGAPQSSRRSDPRVVNIRNARPFAEDLSLDIQGFAFVAHRSAVVNFYNDQLVRQVCYPEVETLLKRRTGARRRRRSAKRNHSVLARRAGTTSPQFSADECARVPHPAAVAAVWRAGAF